MECFCLDWSRKIVNVRKFYDNIGGCVHQFNETVRNFHIHLSESNMKNAAMTTAHLYTLLAKMFEKNI